MADCAPSTAILPATQWPQRPQVRARVAASGVTDVGGAESVNQDAFFVHAAPELGALVLGVFDGHGKETGRRVARAACTFFERQFRGFAREEFARLERDPRAGFRRLFAACHEHIKEALREFHERAGFVVYEQPEGFLVKQDPATHLFANVRGGTTATVAVILGGGRKILVSNVGDSAALLGGAGVSERDVTVVGGSASKTNGGGGRGKDRSSSREDTEGEEDEDEDEEDELDALEVRESCASMASTAASSLGTGDNQEQAALALLDIVALTGDHGAECAAEFLRLRRARCCDEDPSMPALRFLYDTCSASARRLPVFSWSDAGELARNSPGDYFKNVRDEWATVVATPPSALFPDALAFTRSLGDFHMHAYGVSSDPTVVELSLERLVARELDNQDERLELDRRSDGRGHSPLRFTLVVASDGVWDNWKYDELFRSLRDARDDKSGGHADAVAAMADHLIRANLVRAEETFGDQADNMTAVVCELELELLDQ